MKFAVHLAIDMPDAVADELLRTAGIKMANDSDALTALALASFMPLPEALRLFLLSPDHKPIEPLTPTLLTTQRSKIAVSMTIHPNQDADQ